jgi:hypothetical protein
LRSSLHGLALLLGELVLEPLLLDGCCLADLLELSLKVDNPLLLLRRILQQVGLAFCLFCQRQSQYTKVVKYHFNHKTTTRCRQLTVSAVLMVTMLVRKACMSSLSSNQSSCQGV